MARRNSKAHMAYVRSFRKNASKSANPRRRRRTRARRNGWISPGMIAAANPRRRKRSYRRNPSRAMRRRSYRRNPSIMGLNIGLPPLKQVLFAGVGFAGTPVVEGFVNQYVPVSITGSTIGKYAVKIGSAILLAYAVKKVVGQEEGKMVAIGGGAYVLTSAVAEFAPGVIPGLSAYVDTNGMGRYVGPGQIASGLGGFVPEFGSPAIQNSAERFSRY